MRLRIVCCAALFGGCGFADTGNGDPTIETNPRGFEPPVVMNPESPVEYPLSLYERQVGGTVILRLFITEEGTVVPESTRVATSSGEAGLDSAAVRGVPTMEFAPARQDGLPIATLFLQPVHFRHPATSTPGDQS